MQENVEPNERKLIHQEELAWSPASYKTQVRHELEREFEQRKRELERELEVRSQQREKELEDQARELAEQRRKLLVLANQLTGRNEDLLRLAPDSLDFGHMTDILERLSVEPLPDMAQVQPPVEKKLNGYEFACQPWPDMRFLGKTKSSTSRSALRSGIHGVELIENFTELLEDDVKSQQEHLESLGPFDALVPTPSNPNNEARDEIGIQHLLEDVITVALEKILPDVVAMKSVAGMKDVGTKARPDGYFVKIQAQRPIVVCLSEAKTPALTKKGTCLVQQVMDKVEGCRGSRLDALDLSQQIAGNCIKAKTPFAIAYTYEYLWCTFLKPDLTMQYSPAFATNVEGIHSGLNVIRFWVRRAASVDHSLVEIPVGIPVKDGKLQPNSAGAAGSQGAARGAKKDGASLERSGQGNPRKMGGGNRRALAPHNGARAPRECCAGPDSFKSGCAEVRGASSEQAAEPGSRGGSDVRFLELLVEHRDRVTWKVRLAHGLLAVVKAFDTAAARDAELECYDALAPMQGRSIPSVLRRCFHMAQPQSSEYYRFDAAADPRVHGLLLAWVGPEEGAAGADRRLPAAALRRTKRVLQRMHGRGVAHGDVHRRNLAFCPYTGRLVVFDFSHAVTLASLGGDRWQFAAACAEDMLAVDERIARAEAREAAAALARRAGGVGALSMLR
jgi:hypothetical protein